MAPFTIRHARPGDGPELALLQHRALKTCPDMDPLSASFFQSPGLEDGRNLFCAVDDTDRPLGYGLIFSSASERRYIDIKVDPAAELDPAADRSLRDALLARIMERASEMKAASGLASLLVHGCYFEEGRQSIAFLEASGMEPLEGAHVQALTLDLRQSTPPVSPEPVGVTVREWQLESSADRLHYLAAHNSELPNSALTEAQLDRLSQLPHFTTVTAFDGDAVAGSALLFGDGPGRAVLEYLFVLPQWRRRSIARHLVCRALRLCYARGLYDVLVETTVSNDAALALYESVGFRRERREVMLGLRI